MTYEPRPIRAPQLPPAAVLERIGWGLAALAGTAQLVTVFTGPEDVGALVALALQVVGFLVARRLPWCGVAAVLAAPVLHAVLGGDPLITWTTTVVAVFAFIAGGMPALWLGAATVICNYSAVLINSSFQPSDPEALAAAATSLAAAALAAALGAQRRWFAAVQEHTASEIANRDVESTRRVAEERLRIARDLHDVVGHEVAGLSMQLGLAEVLLSAEDAPARAALDAARMRVKSITEETRQILDVLRMGDDEDALQPIAEIENVRDLVGSFSSVGLEIDTVIAELPAGLSRSTSTAAYRIVQESLTNAQRHGEGTVTLTIDADARDLHVTVRNRIRSVPPSGRRGYGLIGMRERAQAAHGRITTLEDAGEFIVSAQLPIDPEGRP